MRRPRRSSPDPTGWGTLLSAIEDKTILPSQLDPARIQFLTAHPDKAIRARAEKLLGGVKLARREQAVAAYRDALTMKADRARGKEVFKRECSTCHKLEGVGYDLGLPLESIQNRGREGILLNVLDPNREVNPSYLNYVIVTNEGLSKTGMIAAETATSITLKSGGGRERHDTPSEYRRTGQHGPIDHARGSRKTGQEARDGRPDRVSDDH